MKTLSQLINQINHQTHQKGIDNALDLLSYFDQYSGSDWQAFYIAGRDEFQYNIIHQDEFTKLILIYWNADKVSNKHGHMRGGGLMRVLDGQLKETRFDSTNPTKVLGEFIYSEGDISYIHDALAYHTIENRSTTAAVTLHLYCSGLRSNFGRERWV